MSSQPPLSDSSQESTEEPRRSCPKCSSRMSTLVYDKHSICSGCRKQNCDVELRCNECESWSVEEMQKYLKHRYSLLQKQKSRAKKKEVVVDRDVLNAEQAIPSVPKSNVDKSSSLSEARVKALIQESSTGLFNEFNESLQQSFSNIHDMFSSLENRMYNQSSFAAPPHPPVQQLPGQERSDPSLSQSGSLFRSRSESVESEGDGLSSSPLPHNLDVLARSRELGSGLGSNSRPTGILRQGSLDSSSNSRSRGGHTFVRDESVNVGASTSGLGRSSVSFAGEVDRDRSVSDDDRDSNSGPSDPDFKGIKRSFRAIYNLIPEAAPSDNLVPPKICRFEGLFSGVRKEAREEGGACYFSQNSRDT